MRERRKRSWQGTAVRVGLLALGVAAFAQALRGADLARAAGSIAAIGPGVMLLLVPHAAWTVAHALAWRQVLELLAVRCSPVPLIGLMLGSEAVRMTVPAGPAAGETLSVYLLKARAGVSLADGISSIAGKKLLVVITNALCAALALIAVALSDPPVRVAGLGERGLSWLLAGAVVVLLAAAASMAWGMTSGGLASAFGRLLARSPSRAVRAWAATKQSAWSHADTRLATPFARRHLGRLASPAALLLSQWLLEAGETWLILRLLGAGTGLVEALVIEVCASLLRSIAFIVPGGLGVQDLGYVAMLAAVGTPEAATVGAAFVLLKRGKELVWIVAGYVILLLWGATSPVGGASSQP